jgi:hypothetical protein
MLDTAVGADEQHDAVPCALAYSQAYEVQALHKSSQSRQHVRLLNTACRQSEQCGTECCQTYVSSSDKDVCEYAAVLL